MVVTAINRGHSETAYLCQQITSPIIHKLYIGLIMHLVYMGKQDKPSYFHPNSLRHTNTHTVVKTQHPSRGNITLSNFICMLGPFIRVIFFR